MLYFVAGYRFGPELMHFGIPGMKWGIRHDYVPIGRKGVSNQTGYINNRPHNGNPNIINTKNNGVSNNRNQKNNEFVSDQRRIERNRRIKKALIVGGTAAAIGLAAYGAYKLNQTGAMNNVKEESDSFLDAMRADQSEIKDVKFSLGIENFTTDKVKNYMSERAKGVKDEATGLFLKSKDDTDYLSDVKKVNLDFRGENAKDPIGQFAMRNCGLCSMTYDMRRRGYDVTAGFSDTALNFATVSSFYKGGKAEAITGELAKSYAHVLPPMNRDSAMQTVKKLSSGSNSRGILGVAWGNTTGGHYLNYEVNDKGVLKLIDCQNSKIYEGNDVLDFLEKTNAVEALRTDNLEFDIEKMKSSGVIR